MKGRSNMAPMVRNAWSKSVDWICLAMALESAARLQHDRTGPDNTYFSIGAVTENTVCHQTRRSMPDTLAPKALIDNPPTPESINEEVTRSGPCAKTERVSAAGSSHDADKSSLTFLKVWRGIAYTY